MIIHQEEKLKQTLKSLSEKPTEQNMFTGFLKLFPEDWKQLKTTYSKFNRNKQANTFIPLPQPEQSLRKEIRIWLKNGNAITKNQSNK